MNDKVENTTFLELLYMKVAIKMQIIRLFEIMIALLSVEINEIILLYKSYITVRFGSSISPFRLKSKLFSNIVQYNLVSVPTVSPLKPIIRKIRLKDIIKNMILLLGVFPL